MRSGDIQEDQFVGPLGIIGAGTLDRIPGVTNVLELRSFHDPPTVDIKAGYDSLAKHREKVIGSSSGVEGLALREREVP
jgi:hypothetical protein